MPDARNAVLDALRLLTDAGEDQVGLMPTSRTQACVDRLSESRPDELIAQGADLRGAIKDLLNWNGPRATKSLVRTAASALTAERDDGAPLCPHAVEALSYLAIWAPLLDPDRLDRVLAHAVANHASAWAPVRYVAGPAARLHRLVGHYQPARIETLACSLWDLSHVGRWWDVCGGLGAYGTRRRRAPRPALEARMQARTQALSAAGGTHSVLEALLAGTDGHYSAQRAVELEGLRLSGPLLDEAEKFAGEDHEDPDTAVLLSHLVDLAPTARPASPVPVMLDALAFLIDEADPKSVLPAKPSGFGDLYPEGSFKEYPVPGGFLAWDMAAVPGSTGTIELIRSPHALFENRDYMGNCTGGYNQRCQAGEYVLGKVHHEGELYNWSARHDGAGWVLGEANSRFNRGNVPTAVRDGIAAMLAEINAGRGPR